MRLWDDEDFKRGFWWGIAVGLIVLGLLLIALSQVIE